MEAGMGKGSKNRHNSPKNPNTKITKNCFKYFNATILLVFLYSDKNALISAIRPAASFLPMA